MTENLKALVRRNEVQALSAFLLTFTILFCIAVGLGSIFAASTYGLLVVWTPLSAAGAVVVTRWHLKATPDPERKRPSLLSYGAVFAGSLFLVAGTLPLIGATAWLPYVLPFALLMVLAQAALSNR